MPARTFAAAEVWLACSAMTWLVCHITGSPIVIWSRATQGRNAQRGVERPNECSIDPMQNWTAQQEVERPHSRSTTQRRIEHTKSSTAEHGPPTVERENLGVDARPCASSTALARNINPGDSRPLHLPRAGGGFLWHLDTVSMSSTPRACKSQSVHSTWALICLA